MSSILIGDDPLAEDVPCMQCGYDLRTKRPSEKCPECGTSVAPSIAAHRVPPSLRNPRRAALGAWLLVAAMLGTEVSVLTPLAMNYDYIGHHWADTRLYIPLQLLEVAIAMATLGGAMLLVSGAAVACPPDTRRRNIRTTIFKALFFVLVLMAALATVLQEMTLWGYVRSPLSYKAMTPCAVAATAAALAVLLIGGWLLARLAWRQRWKTFAGITALLFAAAAATSIGAGVSVCLWWELVRGLLNPAYQWIRFTVDYGCTFLPPTMAFYWAVLALRLHKLKAE
jgi:hypothetical protein